VLTILVIGLMGAVLMSLVMKHLVEVKADRERSPYAAAVESRLGAKRLGPVRIEQEAVGDQVQLTVHARVLSGLDKQRIADAVGLEVWLGAMRAGNKLDVVLVALQDEDQDTEPVAVAIPPPTTRAAVGQRGVPAGRRVGTGQGLGGATQQGPAPAPATAGRASDSRR
jgi:hypothetical protein